MPAGFLAPKAAKDPCGWLCLCACLCHSLLSLPFHLVLYKLGLPAEVAAELKASGPGGREQKIDKCCPRA
jgi:hypothetical protein